MNTKKTALQNLLAAGYAAEVTATGLDVRGNNWSVHYSDLGQDHNEYSGKVPSEVEALAVWDDASTREDQILNAKSLTYDSDTDTLYADGVAIGTADTMTRELMLKLADESWHDDSDEALFDALVEM